jgi:hypothetical protein
VLQEIAYQNVVHVVSAALYRDKNPIWPPLLLWIRSYSFEDIKVAQVEVNILAYFHFGAEIFHRHDPLDMFKDHCINQRYRWDYTTNV